MGAPLSSPASRAFVYELSSPNNFKPTNCPRSYRDVYTQNNRKKQKNCEPLPKPTLSPFALARPGTFLRVGFFTAAVWCVPALRVPLVHSLINHFRKKKNCVEHAPL